LRTRISKIRNRSIYRNTGNRKTEHRQSHIRDVAEDPNLGTYSDWGLSGVSLFINIYHINKHTHTRTHTQEASHIRKYLQVSIGQLEKPFVFVLRETFGSQIGWSLNSSRFHNMSVLYVRNRRSLIRQMQRCLFQTSAGSNCCALLSYFFLAQSHVRLARSLFVSHCARALLSLSLTRTNIQIYTQTQT